MEKLGRNFFFFFKKGGKKAKKSKQRAASRIAAGEYLCQAFSGTGTNDPGLKVNHAVFSDILSGGHVVPLVWPIYSERPLS